MDKDHGKAFAGRRSDPRHVHIAAAKCQRLVFLLAANGEIDIGAAHPALRLLVAFVDVAKLVIVHHLVSAAIVALQHLVAGKQVILERRDRPFLRHNDVTGR
ncbi:hypothetical protein D3C87_1463610 [compost metagenome]